MVYVDKHGFSPRAVAPLSFSQQSPSSNLNPNQMQQNSNSTFNLTGPPPLAQRSPENSDGSLNLTSSRSSKVTVPNNGWSEDKNLNPNPSSNAAHRKNEQNGKTGIDPVKTGGSEVKKDFSEILKNLDTLRYREIMKNRLGIGRDQNQGQTQTEPGKQEENLTSKWNSDWNFRSRLKSLEDKQSLELGSSPGSGSLTTSSRTSLMLDNPMFVQGVEMGRLRAELENAKIQLKAWKQFLYVLLASLLLLAPLFMAFSDDSRVCRCSCPNSPPPLPLTNSRTSLRQPVDEDNDVLLYAGKNHTGEKWFVSSGELNACRNLRWAADKSSSIDTQGWCIWVFEDVDCQGRTARISTDTPSHNDLEYYGLDKKVSSLIKCL